MALNKESNGYTFLFAIILVVVVGTLLAFVAMSLKPFQQENLKKQKMKDILASVGVKANMQNAPELYSKHIKASVLVNNKGDIVDADGNSVKGWVEDMEKLKNGEDYPFKLDVKKQYKDKNLPEDERLYPIFRCQVEGETVFVCPMVGTGLWGPIWGYVSLKEDKKTIYGASFDHKTETPGLGAEISLPNFEDPYKGKSIKYNDSGENFLTVAVVKGGNTSDLKEGQSYVDGITGGTVTSRGVGEMFERTMSVYAKYFATTLK